MTVSLWQRREPVAERVSADVCVVGAGISGLSAAIECSARGLSCVVVEQDYPGARASGRNAGYLMRGAAENYAVACADLGRERARALWRFTEDNLRALRALGAGDLPSFRDRASCLAAVEQEEAEDLERSAQMLREDGFDVELVREVDDALWRRARPLVGLLNPGDAVCSPAELVGLLRRSVGDARVVGDAPVYGIEPGERGVVVRARGIEVVARFVLVCTNAYAGELLPEMAGVVTPNRGQMLALRPADPRDAHLEHAYYIDHGSEYIRSGPDGTVVFGGARKHREEEERTDRDGLNDAVQARLEELAGRYVGRGFEVLARWSGIMGFSRDGLPVVRACEGVDAGGRVWFCGGLTGHGMSMGYLTARGAVAEMLGG